MLNRVASRFVIVARSVALLLCLTLARTEPLRAADSPPAIDIMLALDNSGSMRTNDPRRLLPQVVITFANLLGPDDRLGIVAFDQTARTLLPLSSVKANTFNSALASALHVINYRGRLTDIPGGLEAARKEIEDHGRPAAQRVIVILTDGEIDLGSESRNSDRKIWLRTTILPAAVREGIRIFGIALTADADVELVQSMAETTHGAYYKLIRSDEIPGVFNQIIGRLRELREAELRRRQQIVAGGKAPEPPVPKIPVAPAVPVAPVAPAFPPTPAPRIPVAFWIVVGVGGASLLFAIMLLTGRRAPAERVTIPAARLIDLGGQTGKPEYPIKARLVRIGRLADQNDVVIKSEYVGREHALIEFKDNAFYLRDLRSKNGTFLDDNQVDSDDRLGRMLKHGDIIRFGPFSFRFVVDRIAKAEQRKRPSTLAGQTVRLGGGPSPQPVQVKVDHPARTIEKPSPPAATPADTQVKNAEQAPGDVPDGAYCEFHRARRAVARCAECGHLLCELEDPVDKPGLGKTCRAFAVGGECPHQAARSKLSNAAAANHRPDRLT